MSVDRFSEAQVALQRGDKTRARQLLSQALLADRNNEQAWLMMARLADTEKQVIECLEWALKVNPHNASTQRAVNNLKRRSSPQVRPAAVLEQARSTAPSALAVKKPTAVSDRKTPVGVQLPRVKRRSIPASLRRTNWSLVIGSVIVLLIVLVGIFGRVLAPKDPMEENAILQVGDDWHIPPFNAFEVPGYLLGTDEFGRDLFSRILYAVRPTLFMVAIVAVVRLFLGTLIGLGAGWSNGRFGRIMDALISAALSVPILMVALGAIAMLGAEIGLLAFIVGLSLNGWGETARFVREQTRLVKGQLYIESAQALGASNFQMLFNHILRQIMPMIWMLFAFEISGTLMVTAGLGFLGYYIGGDVWIEVDDFVSRRTSGEPELGQMLATSWVNLLQPWPLVLTGSVVFMTVLGFNLLGDGLRARLNPEYINRNSLLSRFNYRFKLWFEQSIGYPAANWLKGSRLRPALVIVALIVLVGSIYLYQTRIVSLLNPSTTTLGVPGEHIWASEMIDPYGTGWLNAEGPLNPQKLWAVNYPAGLSGNPVISADGTIYMAGLDAYLLALNPDGSMLWEVSLPEVPLGPLAIGPNGDIYVPNTKGGLSAYDPNGYHLWTYETDAFGKPIHGAIVTPDGTIFYLLEDPRGDTLFALQPDGNLAWSAIPGTRQAGFALRLSPDEKQIYVKNVAVNVADGSMVDLVLPTQGSAGWSGKEHFFTGNNGKTYLLAGHQVMEWEQTSQGFSIIQSTNWNYRGLGIYQTSQFPVEAGVNSQGMIRIMYSGYYGATRIVWLDSTGKFLGAIQSPLYQGTRMVATDMNNTSFLCGVSTVEQVPDTTLCEAYRMGQEEPIWFYPMGVDNGGIVGAAMAPGRLYVITGDGMVTALGDGANLQEPAATP